MNKTDAMQISMALTLFIFIVGTIIIIAVPWYIHKKISVIKKLFESTEHSAIEQLSVNKSNEEISYSIKKNQQNILEMNIEFSRKIRLILSKYKNETFDTKILQSLSNEIDETLTGRTDTDEIETDENIETEYNSIQNLYDNKFQKGAEKIQNILNFKNDNDKDNDNNNNNNNDFESFKLSETLKKMKGAN